jgi:predicted 3-demethylubiquinone-9 3-methyltransferase (glyoxalase superfamily)
MQKITPFLWFDGKAEEAMNYYVSLFDDGKVLHVTRQGEGGPVSWVNFELAGQEFMGLNGGPNYQFTEATSFFVNCESQEDVDRLWVSLTSEGGEPSQCGWLKDRYGLSWQIIPNRLGELLGDPDPERSGRVMQAMLGMTKIDIAGLEAAHAG